MTLDQWLRHSQLPRLEARMLLQHAGGYSRVQLVTQGADPLPEAVAAQLDILQARRLKGEPMAYILGGREFYGRWFEVGPDVLIPRPETEHLVEAVIRHLPANGQVWDLGTGSGAVAVTVALERTDAAVRASDISGGALAIARKTRKLWAQGSSLHWVRGLRRIRRRLKTNTASMSLFPIRLISKPATSI